MGLPLGTIRSRSPRRQRLVYSFAATLPMSMIVFSMLFRYDLMFSTCLNTSATFFLMKELFHHIPDVRDGLTREERIVLYVLHETQKERGERNVPTAMLWGRVCEHFYISPEDLSRMLARMGA
jgi:hypothetical protein